MGVYSYGVPKILLLNLYYAFTQCFFAVDFFFYVILFPFLSIFSIALPLKCQQYSLCVIIKKIVFFIFIFIFFPKFRCNIYFLSFPLFFFTNGGFIAKMRNLEFSFDNRKCKMKYISLCLERFVCVCLCLFLIKELLKTKLIGLQTHTEINS